MRKFILYPLMALGLTACAVGPSYQLVEINGSAFILDQHSGSLFRVKPRGDQFTITEKVGKVGVDANDL